MKQAYWVQNCLCCLGCLHSKARRQADDCKWQATSAGTCQRTSEHCQLWSGAEGKGDNVQIILGNTYSDVRWITWVFWHYDWQVKVRLFCLFVVFAQKQRTWHLQGDASKRSSSLWMLIPPSAPWLAPLLWLHQSIFGSNLDQENRFGDFLFSDKDKVKRGPSPSYIITVNVIRWI